MSATFVCVMCGHEHDSRDRLLWFGPEHVCGWCGDGSGLYGTEDPGDHVLTL